MVLSHTSSVELNAFWSIFGEDVPSSSSSVGTANAAGSGSGSESEQPTDFHTNPMTAASDWSTASVRDNTRSFDFGAKPRGLSGDMAYPKEMARDAGDMVQDNPMLNRSGGGSSDSRDGGAGRGVDKGSGFSMGNPMRERNDTAVTRFRGTTQSGAV